MSSRTAARSPVRIPWFFQPTHADWSVRAVVPGSHRLMDNPWELYGTSFRSSLTLDAELPQEAMPNHCECIEATAAVCAF